MQTNVSPIADGFKRLFRFALFTVGTVTALIFIAGLAAVSTI